MNWYRSGKFFSVLVILAVLLSAIPMVAAQEPGVADKIEPALLDKLAIDGQTDIMVRFAEQADLSPAYQMNWQQRGEFVYNTLRETAARSQAAAQRYLASRGMTYQSFFNGNDLYVKAADLNTVNTLAAMNEVALVRATRSYYLDPLVNENAPLAPEALAWGITYTGADQFWTTFGVQGDGIVVGNIDTGVQYNHPALDQSYKCPGTPGDPACWLDPGAICGGSPCDNNGHGTHTMGTMVADDDPSLTYQAGMAPNAQWIACKGCETNSCSDTSLNACADWALAPGGNAANRPDVLNNSWGGGGGDTWYQAKVQAWVAAGIFPAFSAGNAGSSCNTLGSPGDYQESFASAAHDSAGTVASFSSRGPSAFGHDPYTKPNIAAPGVSVCSTVPTNSWSCGYSGTSMASPHTAGAVALLWSCNAALVGQIDLTFQYLQDSVATAPAGNCSAPPDGQGNYTYGYGYLDIYQAGLNHCGGSVEFGYLEGYVRDTANAPIQGATVSAPGGGSASTDASGYYHMQMIPGTYDVTATKNGYTSQTVPGIEIIVNVTVTQDFQLDFMGAWTAGPTMCFDLTRIDAEFYPADGKVYVLGGRSDTSTIPNIYRFDPTTNVCADTGVDMPDPISNYTIVTLNRGGNDLLCTFGGRASSGTPTMSVQCYDPIAGTASIITTLPTAYSGFTPGGLAVVDNQAYVFGGFNNLSSPYELNRTDRYDPIANTFTQVGNLSLARAYIDVAVVDGAIYAFGGTVFDGTNLNAQTRTEVMADPGGAGTWDNAAVAELATATAEGRAFGFDTDTIYTNYAGKIVIAAGGQWPAETAAVLTYDTATDTYDESFPDLIVARRDTAGAFVPLCTPDNSADGLPGMWIIGGRSGSDVPPYAGPEFYPFVCAVDGPPTAEFSSNTPVCLGTTAEFTDESTGSPAITAWAWDFGDGATSTDQNPTHDYAASGIYVVTLEVTNPLGTDTISHDFEVAEPPVASFDYSPTGGPVPLTVYFTNTSPSGANPSWDFGDGATATGDNVNHTYLVEGPFTVTLTVDDPICGADTAQAVVYPIEVGPPTAAFVADPLEGCPPLEVTFTDLSAGDPPIDSWFWDFGDGATSTETNPVHTFVDPGDYIVLLTVESPSGTASISDTITVFPLPEASFDYAPAVGVVPLTVYFTNTSAFAQDAVWDFGDGVTATGDLVNHTYAAEGDYTVVLTVDSAYGCGPATAEGMVRAIVAGPPTADFTADPVEGCAPLDVTFTDESVGDPPIDSWLWDFGDGATSTEQNPVHTYAAAGDYLVVLTVENISGTDSAELTVTVNPVAVASFDYAPASGYAPLTVLFTNTSTDAINPTWDFGDGGTGTGDTVTHDFVAAGVYTVTLTVESPFGCGTVSAEALVTVTEQPSEFFVFLPLIFVNVAP